MKNIQKVVFALLIVLTTSAYGCGGPNDDKGGMSEKNSDGEGAIDSTRLTNFDSTTAHSSDSTSIK